MKVIALQGLKGGVGCTTVTANLASALTQAEFKVLVIDLDPQNDLRLHFAMPWQDGSGWSRFSEPEQHLAELAFRDHDGVYFMPFGDSATDLYAYHWLTRIQDKPLLQQFDFVLLHLGKWQAVGSEVARQQANLTLFIANADIICFSLFNHQQLQMSANDVVLINKFNVLSDIEKDIARLWRSQQQRVVPCVIHQDEAAREAIAFKDTAVNNAPESLFRADFRAFTAWLTAKTSVIND